jgi:hypothetical protein
MATVKREARDHEPLADPLRDGLEWRCGAGRIVGT